MTDKPVPAEVLMSEAEAAAITEEFKATVEEFEGVGIRVQAVALRAQQGGAWKVRKFKSWAEYVEKEIGWSKRHANRMVRAAQFAGELEAASGTRVPPLTERETRSLSTEQRAEVVAEVKEATAGLPKKKREKVAAEVVQRATANFKSQEFKVNLVDPERQTLIDLAVAAGEPSDAALTKLVRSALGHDGWDDWPVRRLFTPEQAVVVGDFAASAGLEPAAFIAKTIAGLAETGEVPTFPQPRATRRPMRSPVLEQALARRTPVEERAVNVVKSLRRDEVAPNFKKAGKG